MSAAGILSGALLWQVAAVMPDASWCAHVGFGGVVLRLQQPSTSLHPPTGPPPLCPATLPPAHRVLLDVDRPAPGGIDFRVLPPMPRLEVSVAGLPPTLLAGEVVRCSMRLRNSGAMTLQRLSMAVAAGAGILLEAGDDGGDGGSSSEGGSGSGVELAVSLRQGVEVFMLPAARLGVGQELTLPIWFRWVCCGPA